MVTGLINKIMSFKDLNNEINLFLQIKEGNGFGFPTLPLIVTANLAGYVHESFVTEPSPHPHFEIEFVWIMDKAKLKCFWLDKIPVRIECLTVTGTHRHRIGYIILNLKDVQIIQRDTKIVDKRIRLLGLSKNVSMLKPALVLSLYMTDSPIQSPKIMPLLSPRSTEQPIRMGDKPLRLSLGAHKEHFLLIVKPVTVNNLKELLPPHSDMEPGWLSYTYSLLGIDVVSDSGVELAISSSLPCLMTYLINNPVAGVSLHAGDLLLGQTTISLESLLLTTDDIELRKWKQFSRIVTCGCEITVPHSLSVPVPVTRPTVEFTLSLQQEPPRASTKKKMVTPRTLPLLPGSLGAGGDADSLRAPPLELPPSLTLVSRSQSSVLPSDSGLGTSRTQQPSGIYTPRSVCLKTRSQNAPTAHGGQDTYRAPRSLPLVTGSLTGVGQETDRSQHPSSDHTVTVTVKSLQLNLPQPHYWIRLSHPSGTVFPFQATSVVDSCWSPLEWQLSMRLPRDMLEPSLAAGPPTLHLGLASQQIACARLPPPQTISTLCSEEQIVTLEKDGKVVGEAEVTWTLGDVGSKPSTARTQSAEHHTGVTGGTEFLSPREREIKILSFVEELEDWADKQRIMVMEELEVEKAAQLSELQRQWEEEVRGQVREGQQLVQALRDMRDQLRQREADLRDSERKLKEYKEDLIRIHRKKLLEFKDSSRRLQDEFNHKLLAVAKDKATAQRDAEELRTQNTELQSQTAELRRALSEAETRLEADKKLIDDLNHDQYILKEKLVAEQESKKFFKDHCRKAEQEIHRLNCLHQQELEERLSRDKKSLEQLVLEQLIVERNEQQQEKQVLNEIRQQLVQCSRPTTEINYCVPMA